jgi:hypothetical protein
MARQVTGLAPLPDTAGRYPPCPQSAHGAGDRPTQPIGCTIGFSPSNSGPDTRSIRGQGSLCVDRRLMDSPGLRQPFNQSMLGDDPRGRLWIALDAVP